MEPEAATAAMAEKEMVRRMRSFAITSCALFAQPYVVIYK